MTETPGTPAATPPAEPAAETTAEPAAVPATPGPETHAGSPIVAAVAPGYRFEETSLELGGLMIDATTLTDTRIRTWVAEVADRTIGFATLGPARDEDADDGDLELYAIYLSPESWGTGAARELMCSYRALPDDLRPGETVLFADGTVAMTVTEVSPGRARLTVTLEAGETIWTESSHKYHADEIPTIAADAGFTCAQQWVEKEWGFAESLLAVK